MHQAGPLCHVASVWRLFLGYLFALPENLITISPINSTSFAKSQTFSLFTIFFLVVTYCSIIQWGRKWSRNNRIRNSLYILYLRVIVVMIKNNNSYHKIGMFIVLQNQRMKTFLTADVYLLTCFYPLRVIFKAGI